jgi:quercetin dioxygenase-like cupin family protein
MSFADNAGVAVNDMESVPATSYKKVSTGTRQFEWETEGGPAWIKILVEAETLGESGAEIAEVFFPPGYVGQPHPHGLEIIYVLEGRLDHIVNGKSHTLEPGMVGVIKAPDITVHKTLSENGVRVLVIWPDGQEVKNLEGLPQKKL